MDARSRSYGRSPRRRSRRHDVAVVFIHGIGVQQPGEALAAGMDALVGAGARVIAAWGREPDSPRTLHIPAQGGQVTRVACFDGWWDDVVQGADDPPRPLRVWWWAFLVLPYLMTHASSVAMMASYVRHGHPEPESGSLRSFARWAIAALQSGYWRMCVVLPLTLGALLLILPIAVGSAALVRLGLVQPSKSRMVRLLSAVVGDAWAYADSPARDEVLDRLECTINEARRSARRVCIVAHSQGAALSRLVCERTDVDTLVTVGSGVQLLGAARRRRLGRVAYGWLMLATYGLIVAYLARAFVRSTVDLLAGFSHLSHLLLAGVVMEDQPGRQVEALNNANHYWSSVLWSQATDNVSIAGMVAGVSGVIAMLFLRPDGASPDWGGSPRTKTWIDIASIYDPVSVGGQALEDAAHVVRVVNARRHLEVLREHVSYFKNPDVARTLVHVVRGEPVSQLPEPRADPLRIYTLSWLWLLPVTATLIYLDAWPGLIVQSGASMAAWLSA